MSPYTAEDILKMIEDHGGPKGLDLSGKDLSGIDLSSGWIREEMERRGLTAANPPPWFSPDTEGINLQGAHLQGARLWGAELWGANLQGATLVDANLQGAELMEANLQGTDLRGTNLQDAHLLEANLQGTDLRGTNLQDAGLWGANLQDADLRWAHLQGARLLGARLERTHLTAGCLGRGVGAELTGSWESAREVYLALKANFLSLGQYDDARWAFIRERRMERKAKCPWREHEKAKEKEVKEVGEGEVAEAAAGLHRRVWGWLRLRAAEIAEAGHHPGASLAWLWNWLQDTFTDYLSNPWKVAAWVPATVLLFTFFYWLSHSPLSLVPGQPLPTFVDYLVFSARTLVTLAFSDMTPGNLWAKVLSPIEGAWGVSLFALFVYCLGRRTAGY